MSTLIYLARHALTDGHLKGILLGRMPGIGLNEKGIAQAQSLAEALVGVRLDVIVSSPVDRARQTAEVVAQHQGLPVHLDERFSEWDMGVWTGKPVAELEARHPGTVDTWRHRPTELHIEGAETLVQVAERMEEGVRAWVAAYPEGRLLIVSHKDPLRALIARLIGLPLNYVKRLDLEMASLSCLRYSNGGYCLECLNLVPWRRLGA